MERQIDRNQQDKFFTRGHNETIPVDFKHVGVPNLYSRTHTHLATLWADLHQLLFHSPPILGPNTRNSQNHPEPIDSIPALRVKVMFGLAGNQLKPANQHAGTKCFCLHLECLNAAELPHVNQREIVRKYRAGQKTKTSSSVSYFVEKLRSI